MPEYRAWEKDLAKPYPLADETRRILDAAFREQALFGLKGGDRLSVITCRRGKGDYTLAALNNTWSEQPLALVSHVGRIRSVEELPTDGAEKTALGFWPTCVTNRVLYSMASMPRRTMSIATRDSWRIYSESHPAMCELDGFLRWAWNSWPVAKMFGPKAAMADTAPFRDLRIETLKAANAQ